MSSETAQSPYLILDRGIVGGKSFILKEIGLPRSPQGFFPVSVEAGLHYPQDLCGSS